MDPDLNPDPDPAFQVIPDPDRIHNTGVNYTIQSFFCQSSEFFCLLQSTISIFKLFSVIILAATKYESYLPFILCMYSNDQLN
jgi:hypothetical protein